MTLDELGIRVNEAVENLEQRNTSITVSNITQILDAQTPFSKKEYASIRTKVYHRLRRNMKHCWKEWEKFSDTPECRTKLIEYEYLSNKEPNGWHEHFIILKESRTFTDEQIEATRLEALVFDWFIKELEKKGWRFLIPDTSNEYHYPSLHDFFIYKFQNVRESVLRATNQTREFYDDHLMLPEGVDMKQLEDHSRGLKDTLFLPDLESENNEIN